MEKKTIKTNMLQEVNVPSGVKQIKNFTFAGCNALKNVDIEESVEELCQFSFGECDSLVEIKLPSSITKIDDTAFYGGQLRKVIGVRGSFFT